MDYFEVISVVCVDLEKIGKKLEKSLDFLDGRS